MQKILLLFFFVSIHPLVYGQEDTVVIFKLWHENDSLQWEDYKVTHKKKILKNGFMVDATTSYQYKFIPGNWREYDCINVATLFVFGSSWVEDTIDHTILEHERIHFDIAELYARKLRKALFFLYRKQIKSHTAYTHKIDSLFTAGKQFQEAYDLETYYGQNESVQQVWKDHIHYELRQLDDYTFEKMQQRCREASLID